MLYKFFPSKALFFIYIDLGAILLNSLGISLFVWKSSFFLKIAILFLGADIFFF
jgi:hypothetical protein